MDESVSRFCSSAATRRPIGIAAIRSPRDSGISVRFSSSRRASSASTPNPESRIRKSLTTGAVSAT